jgi:hypothetical protein
MTNYYTEFIEINKINLDDYISINDNICKVLEVFYELLSNNEYIYNIKCININNKIYNIKMHYNKKIHSLNKKILKYNFFYTFEIWIYNSNNDIIKIKDNFITYELAEEYIKDNNITNYYIIRNIDNIDDVINFY